MISALLFAYNGGAVAGLAGIGGPITLYSIPRPGDFVEIGQNPGIIYVVEYVVYLVGEAAVRLVVSVHP